MPAGPAFAIDTDDVDPEITHDRRAAAGRAGDQRPLRAQRRQRPLGIAVRRAVRHRRAGRPRRRRVRTTRPRGARVIAWAREFLDEVAPAAPRSTVAHVRTPMSSSYSIADGGLIVHVWRRRRTVRCLLRRRGRCRIPGSADEPTVDPARAPRARHRDRHRPGPPDRRHRRCGRRRRRARIGADIDHGLRGLDRRRRQRRQGARLPQLARPDAGHVDRRGDQERHARSRGGWPTIARSPHPTGRR